LVYAVINGAHTLIGYPAGMLSDRIGKENVLMMSYGVFLASTVMMLMSTNSVHAYMLAAVYGAYIRIAETVQRAVVPKYIASEFRGTAYGLYNMVIGFSFLAANLVFGFLLDSIGISAAATYSIITSAVAIAAMGGFQALSRSRKA
jgi:MFS family permease